jgi:hypothetical protein
MHSLPPIQEIADVSSMGDLSELVTFCLDGKSTGILNDETGPHHFSLGSIRRETERSHSILNRSLRTRSHARLFPRLRAGIR